MLSALYVMLSCEICAGRAGTLVHLPLFSIVLQICFGLAVYVCTSKASQLAFPQKRAALDQDLGTLPQVLKASCPICIIKQPASSGISNIGRLPFT